MMLRAVHLRNFVRFRESQKLNFEKDTYFFIGKNGAGKSSILEAVRRCLSSNQSSSYSNVGDPGQDSHVVCKFELPDTGHLVYSCLFHFANDPDELKYKFVIELDPNDKVHTNHQADSKDQKIIQFGFDKIQPAKDGKLKMEKVGIQNKKVVTLSKFLELNTEEKVHEIVKTLKSTKEQKEEGGQEQNSCDTILSPIDKQAVFLFENRGVYPIHWSKTRTEKGQWRDQAKEEIITWFLRQSQEDKDTETEAEFFEIITNSSDFNFYLEKKKIIVEERRFRWDLLKTPGGIIEAKECSILLSQPQFRTVCLEEPVRGMHPQMVQRLRDYVLPKLRHTGKVVLIATHNPMFVTSTSVANTFLFRKLADGNDIKSTIVPGSELASMMKAKRIITDSHISKIFFSSKVLFLEGEHDRIFIKTLFMKIVADNEYFKNALKIALKKSDKAGSPHEKEVAAMAEKLRKFVKGLDIVQMDGATKVKVLRLTAETIGLPHYFLLDKDAIYEGGKLKNLDEMFGFQSQSTHHDALREELMKKCGTFLWKDGALEDMVKATIKESVPADEKGTKKKNGRKRQSEKDLVEGPASKKSKADSSIADNMSDILGNKISQDEVFQAFASQNINVSQRKVIKRSRDKLFGNDKLTDENIDNCVDIMLALCKTKTNDLVQFIQFLIDCSKTTNAHEMNVVV